MNLIGLRVRCVVTGFEGVVTGQVQYITGCNQALVIPPIDDKGNVREGLWLDEQRLQIVNDEPLKLPGAPPQATNPGPDIAPTRRM